MSSLRTNWAGVFPAVITPFANGEFDEVAYRKHLRTLLDDKVDGLVVTGSTGEWYTMSDKERIRAWEIAKEVAGSKVPVIAGTPGVNPLEPLREAKSASPAAWCSRQVDALPRLMKWLASSTPSRTSDYPLWSTTTCRERAYRSMPS